MYLNRTALAFRWSPAYTYTRGGIGVTVLTRRVSRARVRDYKYHAQLQMRFSQCVSFSGLALQKQHFYQNYERNVL